MMDASQMTARNAGGQETGPPSSLVFEVRRLRFASFGRDFRIKLFLLAGSAICGGVVALCTGLRFAWSDAVAPVLLIAILGPLAAWYHHRREERIVLPLVAVLQMLLFTASLSVLIYAIASTAAPLRDNWLMKGDELLGIHVPAFAAWFDQRPLVARWLVYAYNSVLPQSLLVVLLLGFTGRRRPLELFVLRFMLAALVTATVFAFLPATGPFAVYGLAPNPTQQSFLDYFAQIRSGALTAVSISDGQGLVTFPSFHTAWALLLVAAVWHDQRLRISSALLNAAVIVATMSTAWHYFVDVLAGVLVAATVVAATNRLRPWVEADGIEARRD